MTINSHLHAEIVFLRRQLDTLMNEARQNEDKMRRFDHLERLLIGAGSLLELVRLLLSEYKLAFGLEHVTLALLDRDGEVATILEGGLGSECPGLSLLNSPAPLEALYQESRQPVLGAFGEHHQPYFNAPPGAIASVALLPLTRQGALIGSLHFGSADADRYGDGCATDLLERLAQIIAICLESALTQERLKLAGLTDGLTGVQNRRYFEHRCQVEISQARRYRHPLACMFLDIDWFKRINDNHGHPTGDDVLRCVAKVILAQLRAGDTVARYGGEEFVILLPQSELHHSRQIAERIRSSIEEQPLQSRSGEAIKVTISIGLSMLPDGDLAEPNQLLAECLIAAADQALYQAKNSGRNRVVCAGQMAQQTPVIAPWIRAWRRVWRLLLAHASRLIRA
jgi:two-component system cell cycle response regulator